MGQYHGAYSHAIGEQPALIGAVGGIIGIDKVGINGFG
jgi:hypothetical protein